MLSLCAIKINSKYRLISSAPVGCRTFSALEENFESKCPQSTGRCQRTARAKKNPVCVQECFEEDWWRRIRYARRCLGLIAKIISPLAGVRRQSCEERNWPQPHCKEGAICILYQQTFELQAFVQSEDFADWYSQVITRSELIDYYDISGCYILRPWAYSIWEEIQRFFDGQIKALGVQNAYFPLFVPKKALEAEEDHLEGFAPEVAWVTRSGQSELAEPIAIRPTSETIMYPAFARWISSHRDLPMRLNQWTNVVRWEFKNPTPFLRTREFLWQEGHSAFASRAEADSEVLDILDLYARVYEELLAVPVVKGRKSEKEKFAGGLYTTTVEGFIPATGRAIQGATSHCLGQNFANMFDINFLDEAGAKCKVWQNSWGLTTRTIGVMIMVHGDDMGLVLPPRVAPTQVIIVPILASKDSDETVQAVLAAASSAEAALAAAGVRVAQDTRTVYTPAWKYAHWEQKGVPVRLEVGPKDVAKGTVMSVRRDTRGKAPLKNDANLAEQVHALLDGIQSDMLTAARAERDARIEVVTSWEEFVPALDRGNMVLAPWCETIESEEWVKEQTKATGKVEKTPGAQPEGDAAAAAGSEEEAGKGLTGAAKTLCVPMEQPAMPEGTQCFTGNGKAARVWALWGRSY